MPQEPPGTVSAPSDSLGGVERHRYTSQTSLDPVSWEIATQWLLCLSEILDLGTREYDWGSRQPRIVGLLFLA